MKVIFLSLLIIWGIFFTYKTTSIMLNIKDVK